MSTDMQVILVGLVWVTSLILSVVVGIWLSRSYKDKGRANQGSGELTEQQKATFETLVAHLSNEDKKEDLLIRFLEYTTEGGPTTTIVAVVLTLAAMATTATWLILRH